MHPSPRTVNEIVEQRVRAWLADQHARRDADARPEVAHPIITVSREAGAGGSEVARHAAERLGFRLWDQDLVDRIARQTGSTEQVMQFVDERDHGFVEDLLASILMGDAFTGEGYMSRLGTVIRALALRGSAVIVGRGAQFVVLPAGALRVRIIGALEDRVHRTMQEQRLTEERARAEVSALDHGRQGFIRHYYRRDSTDLSAYDLVLNTSSLPIDAAAKVVVAAYRSKFAAP
jgi:cytidylate kinase